MKWRPRFALLEHTICEWDGEYEGWCLQIAWLGCVVELVFAKRERLLVDPEGRGDA